MSHLPPTPYYSAFVCIIGYAIISAEGTPLPVPDYDSDWVLATKCNKPPYCDFRHGLGETPVIVDVQVDDNNVVFNALGKSSACLILIVYGDIKHILRSSSLSVYVLNCFIFVELCDLHSR